MGSLNKRRDDFYHIVCIFSGFLWYLILARDYFYHFPLFFTVIEERYLLTSAVQQVGV